MTLEADQQADQLYFRQFLSGRDFAADDDLACQMVNFVYAVGDRESSEAVLIDPAYDVDGILDLLRADGMECTGVLATHYHPDHVGGEMMGLQIEGVKSLLGKVSVPIHIQADEAPYVQAVTGVGGSELVCHESGEVLRTGAVEIELIHTPGHTPGSQCFLVDGRLVAGDTLFLEGCGRMDLPGADPVQMHESLTTRLAKIPDDAVLYPGHRYSPKSSATMGETRQRNTVLRIPDRDRWLAAFAA